MSLVSSGTSTGRAEVEDRRRSSDWVATIFGIGARAAECSVSVMRNVLKCCESRESETIQHTLFECSAFTKYLARSLNDYTSCTLSRVV